MVEWSDMIMSTQGPQAGAILIEWNLPSKDTPLGMWDVHIRVGEFTGSELQIAECAKTPATSASPDSSAFECAAFGAYMLMYVSKTATNLYLENLWLWLADHDLEGPHSAQIIDYSGRGLFIDGSPGPIWLMRTGVKHNIFY